MLSVKCKWMIETGAGHHSDRNSSQKRTKKLDSSVGISGSLCQMKTEGPSVFVWPRRLSPDKLKITELNSTTCYSWVLSFRLMDTGQPLCIWSGRKVKAMDKRVGITDLSTVKQYQTGAQYIKPKTWQLVYRVWTHLLTLTWSGDIIISQQLKKISLKQLILHL